jgi:hypothetical protein
MPIPIPPVVAPPNAIIALGAHKPITSSIVGIRPSEAKYGCEVRRRLTKVDHEAGDVASNVVGSSGGAADDDDGALTSLDWYPEAGGTPCGGTPNACW